MPSNFTHFFLVSFGAFDKPCLPNTARPLSIANDRNLQSSGTRFGRFSPIAQSNFVNTFSSRLIDKSCLSVSSVPIRLQGTPGVNPFFPCAQNVTVGLNYAVHSAIRNFGVRSRRNKEPQHRNQLFCRMQSFSQIFCVRAGDLQSRRPIRYLLHHSVT